MTEVIVKLSPTAPSAAPVVAKSRSVKAVKIIKTVTASGAKKAATASKSAVKPAHKRVTKSTVGAKKIPLSKPAKPVAAPKPAKAKKPKMVRDSMTMPKAEYAVLDELKLRAAKLGNPMKKTELLRAGIKALAAMSETGFVVALKAVPSLKTGRPSKL